MRRIRLISLILLLLLLFQTVSAAGAGQPPYAIRVNRAMNTVTIYSADASGQYTIPVKAMRCSTARPGYVTPLGTYQLADYRSEWRLMVDGTYGQYATCFSGNYLFHSICYADDSHDAMVRESYNKLGEPASMGCVRLETIDAKWIFDNCPAGTPVTIYDDPESPGPLGKPDRTLDEISEEAHNGWDPTDPAEGNPWRMEKVKSLRVKPSSLSMEAGETAELTMTVDPKTVAVFWSSSDETVAKVDGSGKVTALSAGTAEITARSYDGVTDSCAVRVKGELLPFDDLIPGSWYYADVRRILEDGLFNGVADREFAPNGAMTRAMVVQVLYNLAEKPQVPEALAFADVAEDAWYRDAVAWAAAEGVVNGLSETGFGPERPMTRQELATVLWRYVDSPKSGTDLTAYADGANVGAFAAEAMAWMTAKEILQGSGGKLLPNNQATRIETAVILQRVLRVSR